MQEKRCRRHFSRADRQAGVRRNGAPGRAIEGERLRTERDAVIEHAPIERRRLVVARPAKGMHAVAIHEHGAEAKRRGYACRDHLFMAEPQRRRDRADGIGFKAEPRGNQKNGFAVAGAAPVCIEVVWNEGIDVAPDLLIAADLAVMHEQILAMGERVAIGAGNFARCGGAHMRHEHARAKLVAKRRQIGIRPGRSRVAKDAGRSALAIPAEAAAIAVHNGFGLSRGHGLADQRCFGLDQKAVEPDRFTGISKEAAHSRGSVERLVPKREGDRGLRMNGCRIVTRQRQRVGVDQQGNFGAAENDGINTQRTGFFDYCKVALARTGLDFPLAELAENNVMNCSPVIRFGHNDVDALATHPIGVEAVFHRVTGGEQQWLAASIRLQGGGGFVDNVDQGDA
ncbi:Hypothetical protein AT6N2_L0571 [Agrobacterium tumefaciens]|nr:Hypothetical protein AT6N2_L0571 [Agrobacterium tumefaciens]